MTKVFVTGSGGQLGQCLYSTRVASLDVCFTDRDQIDITDQSAVVECLERVAPDYVVNCAAYTRVDSAEDEPELSHLINCTGVSHLAKSCANIDARLLHISTDFVFDGEEREPYKPDHLASPLSAYGKSKLEGELAVRKYLADSSIILRTSWLYSQYGTNFVKTMLRLMNKKASLNIVHDQLGSPTHARRLAELIWNIISNDKFESGIFHWSDSGTISWYEFAKEIYHLGRNQGLIGNEVELIPIATSAYPTRAVRPACSTLDSTATEFTFGLESNPWQQQLLSMLRLYKLQIH